MIQRLASSAPRALSLRATAVATLAFGCLLGCARPTSQPVPRMLQGSIVRGKFVPPSSYEAYLRGELLLLQGRPGDALAQFELAATAPDEDSYLLSRLALAQALSGNAQAAERTLSHAEELDRCSEAVWLTRGELLERRAELEQASVAFARASACAPRSPAGELALARVLTKRGDDARALEVLARAAQRPLGASASVARERALASASPAVLAHALSGLGLQRATELEVSARAVRIALDRGLPRLALRLREQYGAKLPALLEAEVLEANGRREELAALIAVSDADDLGGAQRTAELALWARAFERAELEATSVLQRQPSDAARRLRAEARLARGNTPEALSDIRALADPTLRGSLLRAALAHQGAPALAAELSVRGEARPAPNQH